MCPYIILKRILFITDITSNLSAETLILHFGVNISLRIMFQY